MMHHAVIVTAAGNSSRFNSSNYSNLKKELCDLNGHSVLYNAVLPFTQVDKVSLIVITYKSDNLEETVKSLENLVQIKKTVFVQGGLTRQQSVLNGLEEVHKLSPEVDYVSIHDGARPFVSKDLVLRTMETAEKFGSCAPVIPIRDTLVIPDENDVITERADRNRIKAIQTPQVFEFEKILKAHQKAALLSADYTDDTQIYGDFAGPVHVTDGEISNIKITYASDLKI